MSLASSRPPSESDHRDTYWFAHTGVEPVVVLSPETDVNKDGLKFEEKLRLCRERQDDERNRRLLEMELSSQQKQRYREQLDEDRRRRIDELKVKDLEKRNAVEERKRLIWEAEQERKEAMLRRSLERDNKMEAKRLAQRNNTSFVFGSSTPRSLDLDLPALGAHKPNHQLLFATPNRSDDANPRRRPVSAYFPDDFPISNSQSSPLSTGNTRDNYIYRSALYSEQAKACLTMCDHNSGHDFNPINGTHSSADDENIMSQSMVSLPGLSRGRKRHSELTPAMPRERIFASSTSRIHNKDMNSKSVSGISEVKSTPKRAVSMTRLDQLAQPRRRYVEDINKSLNNSVYSRENTLSPTRPLSSMSGSNENTDSVKRRVKPTVPRKPRPVSIGSPYLEKKEENKDNKNISVANRGSRATEKQSTPTPTMRSSRARSAGSSPRPLSLASPDMETNNISSTPKPSLPRKPAHVKAAAMARKANKQIEPMIDQNSSLNVVENNTESVSKKSEEKVPSLEPKTSETTVSANLESDNVLPLNNSNKKDISQEEYKKMMAEKRKQAREQAEREAELERERIEKEKLEEEERIRKEEEEQKRLEEEQLRLIAEQKAAEEERLRKAMEENRIREEEESKRKEEELRQKLEKEEKDKKAKEESERQRLELEERLKKDEEERLQRKKKLEAIMSRTRKNPPVRGGSPSNSPNETPEPSLSDSNGNSPEKSREEAKNHQNILKNETNDDELVIIKNSDINTTLQTNSSKPDLVEDANRAVMQNMKDQMMANNQMNGSHNNNIIDTYSSENKVQPTVDNLLDLNGINSVNSRPNNDVNTSIEQLINLNFSTPTDNIDEMNSNHINSNQFIPPNGQSIKGQSDQSITDLLS